MPDYSIEEKRFIAEYHPQIDVKKVVMKPFTGCMGDEDMPDDESCIVADDAMQAMEKGKKVLGFNVEIYFTDKGNGNFQQKFIMALGSADFYKNENEDFYASEMSDFVFSIISKDENYVVSIPYILKEISEEESEAGYGYDSDFLKDVNFQIERLVIGNQFLTEDFTLACDGFDENGVCDNPEMQFSAYELV